MSGRLPAGTVAEFLDLAASGEQRRAVRLTLDLLATGVPPATVIDELLAGAQREVGARWQRGEWSTADEHLASGAVQAALEALASNVPTDGQLGSVVVACAEGDWHALPAQMFAESLRALGQGALFLGASAIAEDIGGLIERRRPDALAVTCNLPLSYFGTARLVDAAHRSRTPVIVGGAALTSGRAERLGADAWGEDAATAVEILRAWREQPPVIDEEPVALDPVALELEARAEELGERALPGLAERFPGLADYDRRQLARTREDLVYIVRFAAAARVVDDLEVFATFERWLAELLEARGVPRAALWAGFEALAPLLREVDGSADLPLRPYLS